MSGRGVYPPRTCEVKTKPDETNVRTRVGTLEHSDGVQHRPFVRGQSHRFLLPNSTGTNLHLGGVRGHSLGMQLAPSPLEPPRQ